MQQANSMAIRTCMKHELQKAYNPSNTMTDISAPSQLDQLEQFTTVVADTGDSQTIKEFAPQDATTNPTLILKAVEKDEYASLADKAVASCRDSGLLGQALVDAVASE